MLLSLLGGGCGVGIGAAVTFSVARLHGWATLVPGVAVWGGLRIAAVVGAVAGRYPALPAAWLAPTDGLRSA